MLEVVNVFCLEAKGGDKLRQRCAQLGVSVDKGEPRLMKEEELPLIALGKELRRIYDDRTAMLSAFTGEGLSKAMANYFFDSYETVFKERQGISLDDTLMRVCYVTKPSFSSLKMAVSSACGFTPSFFETQKTNPVNVAKLQETSMVIDALMGKFRQLIVTLEEVASRLDCITELQVFHQTVYAHLTQAVRACLEKAKKDFLCLQRLYDVAINPVAVDDEIKTMKVVAASQP